MLASFLRVVTLSLAVTSGSAVAAFSDGTDGAFDLSSSGTLLLPPDGRFDFTAFSIRTGGSLTFSGESSTVDLFASGDIIVEGLLDVGQRTLTLATPGRIVIAGTLHAGAFSLNAAEIAIQTTGTLYTNGGPPGGMPRTITVGSPLFTGGELAVSPGGTVSLGGIPVLGGPFLSSGTLPPPTGQLIPGGGTIMAEPGVTISSPATVPEPSAALLLAAVLAILYALRRH